MEIYEDPRAPLSMTHKHSWALVGVMSEIRTYYGSGEHKINMKMAKFKEGHGFSMTKKQAVMFVEAGLIRQEDVVDWEDVKKYTKNINAK